MKRHHVPRPTEDAALRRVGDPPVREPAALFDALLTAYRAADREGVCLFGHAIVRGATTRP